MTVPGVFRPRSDTWLLADVLRQEALPPGPAVLDLCTGSGAVAVSAARAGAGIVVAVDVSRRALLCARLNARLHGARVQARRGDLFAALEGTERFDAIASNPPYLPAASEDLPRRGRARAWEAGPDGRALLDRVCSGAPEHLRPGGVLLLVQSSVCGVRPTLEALRGGGLEVDIAACRRGPLGPLLRDRAEALWAAGRLPQGSLEEDVLVIRARRPVRSRLRVSAPGRPQRTPA